MSRDPLLLLEDIEKSCTKVVRYTEGRSKDDVFQDDVRIDAVLLNLHVIGEAVKKLPLDLRERHPRVAWREIAGLRDVIVHAYFALDPDIIWDAGVGAFMARLRPSVVILTLRNACGEVALG